MGTHRGLFPDAHLIHRWAFDEATALADAIDDIGDLTLVASNTIPTGAGLVGTSRGTAGNNNFQTQGAGGVTAAEALRAVLEGGSYTLYLTLKTITVPSGSLAIVFSCKDIGGAANAWSLLVYAIGGAGLQFYWATSSGAGENMVLTYTLNNTTTFDVLAFRVTASGSNRSLHVFKDGVLQDTFTGKAAPDTSFTSHAGQGVRFMAGEADWYHGYLDESGISNAADSSALILTNAKRLRGTCVHIDSLDVTAGPSGAEVTLTGENFASDTVVTFGGVEVDSYTLNSSTSVTVTVPAHALGSVDVVATDTDGSFDLLADGFEYIEAQTFTFAWPAAVAGPDAVDYGSDVSTLPTLDPLLGPLTGPAVVGQAVARRLRTPRGQLTFHPDYGLDLRQYVNGSLLPGALPALRAAIEQEALKDERVADAVATVEYLAASQSIRVSLQLLTSQGPFLLVLNVSALDVTSPTLLPQSTT